MTATISSCLLVTLSNKIRCNSESDVAHYGNKGRDVALWQGLEDADLPAQMESEVLRVSGTGRWWW